MEQTTINLKYLRQYSITTIVTYNFFEYHCPSRPYYTWFESNHVTHVYNLI